MAKINWGGLLEAQSYPQSLLEEDKRRRQAAERAASSVAPKEAQPTPSTSKVDAPAPKVDAPSSTVGSIVSKAKRLLKGPINNAAFYEALTTGDIASLPKLKHVWQFAAALKACTDDATTVALAERNPKLAAEYAAQEAVLEALNEPNPLHAAVEDISNDDAVLLLVESAPEDVRTEYADDLALAEYTQDQLCSQYVQLVLGETV